MNTAILLSGGTGSRVHLNIPKQYIRHEGHMMVTFSLRALLECRHIDSVCIVADSAWTEAILTDAKECGLDISRVIGFAAPGANRQGSVLNGMELLISRTYGEKGADFISDDDTVLIHDAARPFLSEALLDGCYESIEDYDGVMPVLPMKDTVYQSVDGVSVSKLLNRDELFAGQAPELFRLKGYYDANKALWPDKILDIRGATEPAFKAGMNIRMIPGDEDNIKITTDKDMEIYRERIRGLR